MKTMIEALEWLAYIAINCAIIAWAKTETETQFSRYATASGVVKKV